jgi:hypothetical protein
LRRGQNQTLLPDSAWGDLVCRGQLPRAPTDSNHPRSRSKRQDMMTMDNDCSIDPPIYLAHGHVTAAPVGLGLCRGELVKPTSSRPSLVVLAASPQDHLPWSMPSCAMSIVILDLELASVSSPRRRLAARRPEMLVPDWRLFWATERTTGPTAYARVSGSCVPFKVRDLCYSRRMMECLNPC